MVDIELRDDVRVFSPSVRLPKQDLSQPGTPPGPRLDVTTDPNVKMSDSQVRPRYAPYLLLSSHHNNGTNNHHQQPGPLSLVEECRGSALIGPEMLLRQLTYAIKNQLVASKAPY